MKHQIATDSNQSKRLLACGVDPNTADMLLYNNALTVQVRGLGKIPDCATPAWSLSQLLTMLPKDMMWQGLYYRLVMGPFEYGWEIEYNDLSVTNNLHRVKAENLIEAVVQMIEWLTANEYKLNEK